METESAHLLMPRKKPAQRRSAATVAAIIEAAARILETSGLEAYNTNAIAERAGVSIGSIYQYFPTKDAVTRALVQREATLLMQDIASLPSGRTGLKRFIAAAAAHQLRRPVLARVLDIAEARLPPDPEVEIQSNRIAEIFSKCLCGADLPDTARLPEAVDDLLAIIRGVVDTAGRRGERDRAALVARVSRAVFGYLEW